MNFYPNGLKLDERVGGGVFSELSINLRLPDHCSASGAEIAAIKEAVGWLLLRALAVKEVYIYSDSQAAIRVLSSLTARSKLVGECLKSLSMAANY